MDNELILWDRLEVIKTTIETYREENFYISFSGGKDSTVLHHLVDMALPGNRIPRVFCNTGIEYNAIVDFVKEFKDERFVIIQPKKNIRETLQKVGYPFKSKEHSHKVGLYQRGSRSRSVMKYLNGGNKSDRYACPKMLKYQFTDKCTLKISDLCCYELKKKPFKEYEKKTGRSIVITGMMQEEKGQREHIGCIVTKNNNIVKFHPMAKVTKEWEEWFIQEYKIKLCELYYDPYNFERTGCKGCPFSLSTTRDNDKVHA